MPNQSIKSVMAAIDYIEANITEDLDLSRVAEAVHYSKYHLHRTFSGVVGMTLHDYIQRRKLTEAAKLLVFSEEPILDIAQLSGYESQQAFTSIFTAMYKLSPNRYREDEQFYPLQLKFDFGGCADMSTLQAPCQWQITPASSADIPCWMGLVRLVVDGFPHLDELAYAETLKAYIGAGQALILKDGESAIGAMLFSRETGSIDFMGTHPLYRRRGIPRAFLSAVLGELLHHREISTTTFRAGDKADTGHRRELLELGFAEAELLTEFGYPTQRLVLPQEERHDK